MATRPVLAVSAAALAAALAAPAVAPADSLFTGTTQQDRKVTVRLADNGVANLVRIGWRTRRCRSGEFLQDVTVFRPPFDTATAEAFSDRGTYTLRQRRIRIRVTIEVSGRRVADPTNPGAVTWQGTVRSTGVVRRGGRVIDRCTLRSIGWTAQPR